MKVGELRGLGGEVGKSLTKRMKEKAKNLNIKGEREKEKEREKRKGKKTPSVI